MPALILVADGASAPSLTQLALFVFYNFDNAAGRKLNMQKLSYLVVDGTIIQVMVRLSRGKNSECVKLRRSGELGDFLPEHSKYFQENRKALCSLQSGETVIV
jgi:hypothetical protein